MPEENASATFTNGESSSFIASPSSAASEPSGRWQGFAGEDGTFAPGWQNHLPEELGESRAGLAKFRNLNDFGKSYLELQKTLGQKANAVPIPGERSTPEEIAAYRRAVGVPERLEEYAFKPDRLPDGVEWNPEIAGHIAAIAHKNNIPPAAMKQLAAAHAEIEAQRAQEYVNDAMQQHAEGKATLQREWGTDFDKNIVRASQIARLAGADPNSPGFSDPNVVKALFAISRKLSDDNFINGDGTPMVTGGAAAARDIQTNKNNPHYERYQSGDPEIISLVRRYLQQN